MGLVAAVSAEAQFYGGQYPYSGLVGGYPYTSAFGAYPYAAGLGYNLAAVPFGSSSGLDPITQGADPVTQGYSLAPYAHHYGKREADAEPEAEAQYLTYGGLGAYNGLGYYPATTAYNGLYNGYNGAYNGYNAAYSVAPYAHHYGKREAEADAQYLTYGGLGAYNGLSAYNGLNAYDYGLNAYTAYNGLYNGLN